MADACHAQCGEFTEPGREPLVGLDEERLQEDNLGCRLAGRRHALAKACDGGFQYLAVLLACPRGAGALQRAALLWKTPGNIHRNLCDS
jgi:hypothetical protein